jgi:hypothetical protein
MLEWWQHSTDPLAKLPLIRDLVQSAEIVDDATLIDVAAALVDARLPRNARTLSLVSEICADLSSAKPWSFYAKAWILSKYGTASDLMKLIESSVSLWVTEAQTSRLVGGLYPRFLGTREFTKYRSLITRSGNQWCREVFNFFESLTESRTGFTAVRPFISSPNPSLPNKISHSKFLMFRAVFKNKHAVAALTGLKAVHGHALTDEYYNIMLPANQRKPSLRAAGQRRKAA